MATQAYRHLLRATRIAFAGDERVLSAARDQIRSGFRDKASLAASDPAVAPALKHAQEVTEFLKSNLVQGRREADDRYSTYYNAVANIHLPDPRMVADVSLMQNYGYTSTPSEATMTR